MASQHRYQHSHHCDVQQSQLCVDSFKCPHSQSLPILLLTSRLLTSRLPLPSDPFFEPLIAKVFSLFLRLARARWALDHIAIKGSPGLLCAQSYNRSNWSGTQIHPHHLAVSYASSARGSMSARICDEPRSRKVTIPYQILFLPPFDTAALAVSFGKDYSPQRASMILFILMIYSAKRFLIDAFFAKRFVRLVQ